MQYKIFTETDKEYLLKHYQDDTYADIGKVLGFNAKRIGREVLKLGLRKAELPYNSEEIDYIRNNYATTEIPQMAKVLGRTVKSIMAQANKIGAKKPQRYTKEQHDFMLKHANDMTYVDIAKSLGVPYSSVQSFLYNKGYKHKNIFSDEDIKYIKEHADDMDYQEIADYLGFERQQVQAKANALGFRKRRYSNIDYFHNIDTPEKAYYLGFIFADGWICYSKENRNYEFGMQLQHGDKYILQNLNHIFGDQYIITEKEPHEMMVVGKLVHVGKIDCLRVYSKELVQDLMSHGIELNKSQKDTYPVVNDSLFFDFLRGYIDGDGCFYVDNKKTYMHITCASEVPLKYIQEKLRQFDIETHLYKETQKKYRLMCINTKEMIKLVRRMYYSPNIPCLTRKYDRIKHLL